MHLKLLRSASVLGAGPGGEAAADARLMKWFRGAERLAAGGRLPEEKLTELRRRGVADGGGWGD